MKPALLVVLAIACQVRQVEAQRRPLTAVSLTSIPHPPTTFEWRSDSRGGYTKYALNGRIEAAAGADSFFVTWMGHDGVRKRVVYEPRTKTVPVIESAVVFDSASRLFTYSYRFANGAGAKQRLQTVYIEAAGATRAGQPRDWYSRRMTEYLREQFGVSDGWVWSDVEGDLGIAPGASEAGFTLQSASPPGVVRCFAEGTHRSLKVSGEPVPPELVEGLTAVAFRLPAGKCVGPVIEPPSGDAATALRRLTATIDAAAKEGWLGSDESGVRIRNSVSVMRAAISAGNLDVASAKARDLAAQVTTQRSPEILSEGRALLEFGLARVQRRLVTAR